jgi:hypothetical protein
VFVAVIGAMNVFGRASCTWQSMSRFLARCRVGAAPILKDEFSRLTDLAN